MEAKRERTCAELVGGKCEGELNNIRLMLDPTLSDYLLVDDGTLDTVIRVGDELHRFSSESFDQETPIINQVEELFGDEIRETMRDRFGEYALDFSYVQPDTFNDQPKGYARYQISWGGPSSEIRFYCDDQREPYRVEYWYMDWGDGASVDITAHPVTELLQYWLGFDQLRNFDVFWSGVFSFDSLFGRNLS
tara:strand:+ start:94 stop:669 length:576 start_codon:yes stop_codon:yes gene_type:complete